MDLNIKKFNILRKQKEHRNNKNVNDLSTEDKVYEERRNKIVNDLVSEIDTKLIPIEN